MESWSDGSAGGGAYRTERMLGEVALVPTRGEPEVLPATIGVETLRTGLVGCCCGGPPLAALRRAGAFPDMVCLSVNGGLEAWELVLSAEEDRVWLVVPRTSFSDVLGPAEATRHGNATLTAASICSVSAKGVDNLCCLGCSCCCCCFLRSRCDILALGLLVVLSASRPLSAKPDERLDFRLDEA